MTSLKQAKLSFDRMTTCDNRARESATLGCSRRQNDPLQLLGVHTRDLTYGGNDTL